MTKYAILISVFLFPFIAVSQTMSYIKKEADIAMENGDYPKALAHAEEILKTEENNLQYQFNAAKASFEIRAYPLTLRYLDRLMAADTTLSFPASYLLMAETKCILGEYEEAVEFALEVLDKNLGGEFERKRASRIVEICDWASGKAVDVGEGVEIRNLRSINTEVSDFPIVFGNEKLRYVTYRQGTDASRRGDGQNWCNCSDECAFRMDWTRYGLDNSLSDTINFPGEKRNLSHFTFSGSNHRVYFSSCECDENEQVKCTLFYREQSGEGWGPAIKLPDRINKEGYSAKQPFLVSDFSENGDRLFFVSNMPSPFGGWDIWYTDVKDGRFSRPVNFAEVNTIEDEITPYFHEVTQTFYFSSNGLLSLGGFDVYKIQRTGSGWCFAANLGAPVNSSFEESYYILNESGNRAFLASNRNNVNYDDPDYRYCCSDIYEVTFPSEPSIVDIVVKPFHKITLEPLEGVQIDLRNTTDDLSLGAPDEVAATEYIYRKIPLEKQFEAYGERSGFLPDSSTATTVFDECDVPPSTVYVNLYLAPKINLIVSVFDKITEEPFDKGATVELLDAATGKVLQNKSVPDEGPHRYYFELEYDRDYQVRTYKSGASEYVAFSEYKFIDSRVTKITQTLETELYLFKPLPLYFDHAIPNRLLAISQVAGDTLVRAGENYGSFYEAYTSDERQRIYWSSRCDRNMTGNERRSEVNDFFDQVEEGKNRLDVLAQTLINRLENGNYQEIQLQVSGFASPVGDSLRNLALSHRRSNSLEKYLQQVFINEGKVDLAERLEVELTPFGDRQGKGKYSCDGPGIRKRCCEVFGIPASLERRVEITNIQFIPGPPGDDEGR